MTRKILAGLLISGALLAFAWTPQPNPRQKENCPTICCEQPPECCPEVCIPQEDCKPKDCES